MSTTFLTAGTRAVALLAEGVDRNRGSRLIGRESNVALLAEGVDRNNNVNNNGNVGNSRPPRGGRG